MLRAPQPSQHYELLGSRMFRDISHILAPSKVGEQEVDAEKKTVSAMADQERIIDVSPQGETAASSHGADATESPSIAERRRYEADRGVQLLTSLLEANQSALDQDVNNLKEERLALKKRKKELSAQLRNKETETALAEQSKTAQHRRSPGGLRHACALGRGVVVEKLQARGDRRARRSEESPAVSDLTTAAPL